MSIFATAVQRETALGECFCAKKYRHIEEYENEIIEMKEKGLTHSEIGDKLEFIKEQIKEFLKRYNAKKRKLEAGIALKTKRRPPKNCEISQADKTNELKYILARKEARIKTLEMENEIMRGFLWIAERK